VELYLPRFIGESAGETADEAAPELPSIVTPSVGTILVVEDEEAVRTIVTRTLQDAGYEVIQARDGREALARLEDGEGIALVLTDMVMPVMGGRELGERLGRERPDLPLIYMSGYPRDTALDGGSAELEHPFLQKPVPAERLVRTVADALARGRAPRRSSSVSSM
jgi:CheY-like chemotaxis protein